MKRTVYAGLLTAFSCILSYIESLLPVFIMIPGAKLGLANAGILAALYLLGWKVAFLISVLRIVLMGLLFGNLYSFVFSMTGGLFSYLIMTLLMRTKKLGITGVSTAGGVAHNIGQCASAAVLLGSNMIIYYLPVLIFIGAITGFLIGIAGLEMKKRLDFIAKEGI